MISMKLKTVSKPASLGPFPDENGPNFCFVRWNLWSFMPNKGKQAIPHVSEHVAFNIAGTVRNIKKQKPSHRTFLNKQIRIIVKAAVTILISGIHTSNSMAMQWSGRSRRPWQGFGQFGFGRWFFLWLWLCFQSLETLLTFPRPCFLFTSSSWAFNFLFRKGQLGNLSFLVFLQVLIAATQPFVKPTLFVPLRSV